MNGDRNLASGLNQHRSFTGLLQESSTRWRGGGRRQKMEGEFEREPSNDLVPVDLFKAEVKQRLKVCTYTVRTAGLLCRCLTRCGEKSRRKRKTDVDYVQSSTFRRTTILSALLAPPLQKSATRTHLSSTAAVPLSTAIDPSACPVRPALSAEHRHPPGLQSCHRPRRPLSPSLPGTRRRSRPENHREFPPRVLDNPATIRGGGAAAAAAVSVTITTTVSSHGIRERSSEDLLVELGQLSGENHGPEKCVVGGRVGVEKIGSRAGHGFYSTKWRNTFEAAWGLLPVLVTNCFSTPGAS